MEQLSLEKKKGNENRIWLIPVVVILVVFLGWFFFSYETDFNEICGRLDEHDCYIEKYETKAKAEYAMTFITGTKCDGIEKAIYASDGSTKITVMFFENIFKALDYYLDVKDDVEDASKNAKIELHGNVVYIGHKDALRIFEK